MPPLHLLVKYYYSLACFSFLSYLFYLCIFLDSFSAIASSLPANDTAVKTIAAKAVTQMGERRGGKHSLKHIGQVRKVMVNLSFTSS